MKVFWSWQNDRPVAVGKNFIEDALEKARLSVADDLALSPAERPELDHDNMDETAMAETVNTIFAKITDASVFVADVTPIATTEQGKEVSDPNVMIELGHAIEALGREHIILVANTFYGGQVEDLPFDLRRRRCAITYQLDPTDDAQTFSIVMEQLVADLVDALCVNLETAFVHHDAVADFPRHPSREGDPSIWLNENEPIKHGDFFDYEAREYALAIVGNTRSYFRIAPAGWEKAKPTRLEVQNAPNSVRLWPLGSWQSGDGGVNRLGVVVVGLFRGKHGESRTATQWFDKTGEVWGFDGGITDMDNGSLCLDHWRLLKDWSVMLTQTLAFYTHLSAMDPYRVEVGVAGLDAVVWASDLLSERTHANEPHVSYERTSSDWGPERQLVFLTDAYNQLCKVFDRPPVTVGEVKRVLTYFL